MTGSSAELVVRLAAHGRVETAPEALQAVRDRWPGQPRLAVNPPRAAIRPASIADLQAVIRLARASSVPLVPVGGGSNVVGAVDVPGGAIVLDLRDLRAIDPVDPRSLVVRAEAGVFGGDLADALERDGFLLPHDPQSLELSTVGGWIATRASGIFSTGYGGIESLVAGLEVVLPDGELLVTGRGPRSAAGPNLSELFVGSEGAFGIVAAARLRVRRHPEARLLRAHIVPTFESGLDLVRGLVQDGVPLAAVRLYDPIESVELGRRLGSDVDGCLLVTVVDGPADIAAAAESRLGAAVIGAAGRDLGRGPAEAWYRHRHACEWLDAGNDRPGRIADAIEVAADWGAVNDLAAGLASATRVHADEVWLHVSHVYPQGASVYVIAFIRRDDPADAQSAYRALWESVMDRTLAAGGTITHHHGVGQVRLPWLAAELGAGLDVLRAIKHAVDPERLLSPGRLSL
ncbi:MAG TPA: FAD-binding oxidoreductase [Candidatus Limnocylindrales bacterium]|nr:FAD-binding oxidoreductase [Candidatus Limnocylindrales bacterium]